MNYSDGFELRRRKHTSESRDLEAEEINSYVPLADRTLEVVPEPAKERHLSGSSATTERPSGSTSERKLSDELYVPSSIKDMFSFFLSELTRGYDLSQAESRFTQKRKKVYAFIKIPQELEKFLFYGLLQCFDAFLYIFTFLPIRFMLAMLRIITRPCRSTSVQSSEICDVIKVIILVASSMIIAFVDTSAMYHVIRGQAVIKLYIFYNMLEVADKLFSSIGQDILDALFWTATESRDRKREHLGTIAHLIIAIVYVVLHTGLVLFQATTLNVAFNSQNKALMTIMMSNNFVELKGSVFKKFAKNNLFQMSCSDVRERFHYCILLTVVVTRNMSEFNWKLDHFWEMLPDIAMVVIGEFFVDWIKHCFITKFNDIPYEVYKDFTITIAYDAANCRRTEAFSDYADQVSRRMGFIPLPLSVLLIRVLPQALRLHSRTGLLLLFPAFMLLLLLRVLNSIMVIGWANQYVREYEAFQKQAEFLKRMQTQRRARSMPGSPRLSLIEFSDVMQQQHPVIKGFTLSDILPHVSEEQMRKSELSRWPQRDETVVKRKSSAHVSLINSHQSSNQNQSSPAKRPISAKSSANTGQSAHGENDGVDPTVLSDKLLAQVNGGSHDPVGLSISVSGWSKDRESAPTGSGGTNSSGSGTGGNDILGSSFTSGVSGGSTQQAPKLPRSQSVVQIPKLVDTERPLATSPGPDTRDSPRGLIEELAELVEPQSNNPSASGGTGKGSNSASGAASPTSDRQESAVKPGECESLAEIDRFTLCNDDRIVM